MTVTTAKWTLDDYHLMIQVGLLKDRHVELLNGEIVEMPPEGSEHAQLSTDAGDYLRPLLGERAIVRNAKPITIPATGSEPEPDVAIVQPLRTLYRTRHPYPENVFLIIEYSNTSLNKDLDAKKKAYAMAGILEYWVVDLQNHLLKVFRNPVNGSYTNEVTLVDGEVSLVSFPEIKIPVKQLFT